MRGETWSENRYGPFDYISIHSPHARGDTAGRMCPAVSYDFNPLPSCEGRPFRLPAPSRKEEFQSTPLMRGETRQADGSKRKHIISIHSPHARGDWQQAGSDHLNPISIHSPHARGDRNRPQADRHHQISIHSPHARGDGLIRPDRERR